MNTMMIKKLAAVGTFLIVGGNSICNRYPLSCASIDATTPIPQLPHPLAINYVGALTSEGAISLEVNTDQSDSCSQVEHSPTNVPEDPPIASAMPTIQISTRNLTPFNDLLRSAGDHIVEIATSVSTMAVGSSSTSSVNNLAVTNHEHVPTATQSSDAVNDSNPNPVTQLDPNWENIVEQFKCPCCYDVVAAPQVLPCCNNANRVCWDCHNRWSGSCILCGGDWSHSQLDEQMNSQD
jgi:hypothetical protein